MNSLKVVDLETFIAKARMVHGDRFDYSDSVYVGAYDPIFVKCNGCNKQIRIAQAETHYRQNKKVPGCRACYGANTRQCSECKKKGGVVASGLCRACDAQKVLARKQEMERRRNRPCIACGKPINKTELRSTCCSYKCNHAAKKVARKTISCAVCGSQVTRTQKRIEASSASCCSLQCQRVYSARVSANKNYPKWKRLRIPVLLRCKCGELSKKIQCGSCAKWQSRINSLANQKHNRQKTWREALNTLCDCNMHRVSKPRIRTKPKAKPKNPRGNWVKRLSTVERNSTKGMTWKTKLSNKAGNHRQRMERKSRAKSLKSCVNYRATDATTAASS